MSSFYQKILRPAMFRVDAEAAHEIGIKVLETVFSSAAVQRSAAKRLSTSPFGPLKRFGLEFNNPVGMAAGFDKNGKVVNQLAALGFAFVEVGTVTYEPQQGNERPRLFRLPKDEALINRLGFNNEGAEAVARRLRSIDPQCVVGVNIGKNKSVSTEAAAGNYLASLDAVHAAADYVAVNVSSPNTPNLRDLQQSENLGMLIAALQKRNAELGSKPLLVKIAPDLSEADIEAVVDICIANGVAGMIATNTTVSRVGLKTADAERFGSGGLSGRPLAQLSNTVISAVFRHSRGKLPIIGVGGIFGPEDAFDKIAAGACLIQAYTGFVYRGISFARDINLGLARILKEKGFSTLDEAVGSAHKH